MPNLHQSHDSNIFFVLHTLFRSFVRFSPTVNWSDSSNIFVVSTALFLIPFQKQYITMQLHALIYINACTLLRSTFQLYQYQFYCIPRIICTTEKRKVNLKLSILPQLPKIVHSFVITAILTHDCKRHLCVPQSSIESDVLRFLRRFSTVLSAIVLLNRRRQYFS